MSITRRDYLKASVITVSTTGIRWDGTVNDLYNKSELDHDKLATIYRDVALNLAADLGSDYADVRLTYTKMFSPVGPYKFINSEFVITSIRVLVKGYWGYSCTSIWSEKSVIQAVHQAYDLAKAASKGPAREINLDLYKKPGESGSWIMPVRIDPFSLNPYELLDYRHGLYQFIYKMPRYKIESPHVKMDFMVSDKWFGATNGSRQFQRIYRSSGSASFSILTGYGIGVDLETLPISGLGYELFVGQDLYGQLAEEYDKAIELAKVPIQPIEVGRYNVLLTGSGVGSLFGATLGPALELDRIIGAEANAGGTSFIAEPDDIGTLKVGDTGFNVEYERSVDGSAGTRRWDDEGAVTTSGLLIENGIVKRAFSDREMMAYLKSENSAAAGNSICGDPTISPSVRISNLSIGSLDNSFSSIEELVKEMGDGIYFRRAGAAADFQLSTGLLSGDAYQVKNGKIVGRPSGGWWFKTSEIWNNIIAMGSSKSVQRIGFSYKKGEPVSHSDCSISAPAMLFQDATIIDVTRK